MRKWRLREVESNDSTRVTQLISGWVKMQAQFPWIEILCCFCIKVDCFSCVSLLQWEGLISCLESPEGLILLALPQAMPNCFSSPPLQGGVDFPHLPLLFWQHCPPLSWNPELYATAHAQRPSRVPVTHSCPRYSEFCVLQFGWFLQLLCQDFSLLHPIPWGCAVLWH